MADEANAVETAVEQTTTVTESAPVEQKVLEVVREGAPIEPLNFDPDTKEVETEEPTEPVEEPKVDTEEVDEKPLGEKGQRRLQRLANEKKALEERVKQLEAVQVVKTQPLTEEEAIERGLTPEQARIEKLERNVAISEERNNQSQEATRIVELNTALTMDADNVVRDFPEMDMNNKEAYDPEYTANVMAAWQKHANVQYATDADGSLVLSDDGAPIVLSATESLYDYVNNINGLSSYKAKKATIEGQKAAEQNLAAVEIRPTGQKVDNRDDSKLSAEEYAKKHGLTTHR